MLLDALMIIGTIVFFIVFYVLFSTTYFMDLSDGPEGQHPRFRRKRRNK